MLIHFRKFHPGINIEYTVKRHIPAYHFQKQVGAVFSSREVHKMEMGADIIKT